MSWLAAATSTWDATCRPPSACHCLTAPHTPHKTNPRHTCTSLPPTCADCGQDRPARAVPARSSGGRVCGGNGQPDLDSGRAPQPAPSQEPWGRAQGRARAGPGIRHRCVYVCVLLSGQGCGRMQARSSSIKMQHKLQPPAVAAQQLVHSTTNSLAQLSPAAAAAWSVCCPAPGCLGLQASLASQQHAWAPT